MKMIKFVLIFLMALCVSAEAGHRHHRLRVNHQIQSKMYVSQPVDPLTTFFRQLSGSQAAIDRFEAAKQRYAVRAPKFHAVELAQAQPAPTFNYFGASGLASRAYKYIGANAHQLGLPSRLWCADFMNMITRSGWSRSAFSYLSRGRPAPYGCTDCVAVTTRKGGGHVGIVTGYDGRGNPVLISGNHGRRVGVGTYSKFAVVAYRYL
jgi:uncharacterized protein (TIGR02594 family)